MYKIPFYLLLILFLSNCKENNAKIEPEIPPTQTKKIYENDKFYGTFETEFTQKFSDFENQTLRISIEKAGSNKIILVFYTKCKKISQKVAGDLISENSFTIKEQNFENDKISGEAKFNQNNEIEFFLNSNSISFQAKKITETPEFAFPEPKINKIYPLSGFAGDEITIEGQNFNPMAILKFGDEMVEIKSFTSERIILKIPKSSNSDAEISYSEGKCFSIKSATKFHFLKNSWQPISELGGVGRWYATGFSDSKHGIVGLGMDPNRNRLADFWSYDPASNSWSEYGSFGGLPRNGAVFFTIGNKVYIGTGYNTTSLNDFFELDLQTKEWKQLPSIPDGNREHATAFAANGKGYVMGGKGKEGWKNDVWEFDPNKNQWLRLKNIAGEGRAFMTTMVYEDKILIGGGLGANGEWHDEWYIYEPKYDTWTLKTKFYANEPNGFVIDGIGYCIYDDGRKLAKYDFESNSWRNLEIPKELTALHATIFQIGDKVYYGTGFNGEYSRNFWVYEP